MNTLKEKIDELELLHRKATSTPWYIGDAYEDDDDQRWCPVGPSDMEHKAVKHPYEDTITEFWGDNHNCEANAKFVVAAVNLVPELIARIRELEKLTTSELSQYLENALTALEKWRRG
ncbi:MAG: hypothetical protein EKK63_10905 [Acinetobacter sp.]|uniref:hypothetical protein n=1 Tax=Acinetobacter sp. TaxID=472 RepID=UPI000F96FDD6|nr:hypothetical protein [Acinetobacter sp.]RUP38875.1 MAG: hypothetical protein EKK63_10905 [Acinetobacter sp.]